jgi:hypothetical protein
MKKIISLLALLLVLNIGFSSTKLAITNVELSDLEIYPGEAGTISFNVQNLDSNDLTNLRISLSSQLIIDQPLFNIGTIKSTDSKFIIFTYTAPLTLSSGSYSLSIEAKYDDGGQQLSSQSGDTVKVLSSNNLIINNYTTSLLIDSLTNFSVTLNNQGNDVFKNVFLTLLLPNGFIPTKGSQFYIDSINPGEIKTISTQILTDKEIEPEAYQFMLVTKSNNYMKNTSLNLVTVGKPKLSINNINLDPKTIMSNTLETISVQLENLGSSKAYSIKSELIIDDEFLGIKFENLGSLDREDITSTIFEITIPASQKRLTGEIKITYLDELGNELIVSENIDYQIIMQQSNVVYYVIVLVVGVVAYFVYRKLKKKK